MSNIPAEIHEVYEELANEITWLHGRWIMYRQLFAESERRIDLLNESASAFFKVIQDVLLGEVQISLSKLTDPAATGTFDNLSLEQLQKRVESNGDKKLADDSRPLLDDLKKKCEPFRKWRNKRLAHLDLTTSLEKSINPLPGISRQMVEDALSVVRDYMNGIQRHYDNTETAYDLFSMRGGDADALVELLKHGLRYEKLLKDDSVSFDDWAEGKWSDD